MDGFRFPEDRARAWDSIAAVLAGQVEHAPTRISHAAQDGSLVWILDQASVMERDTEGRPLRMCGTHTDISAIKAAEEKLTQHRRHLEKLVDVHAGTASGQEAAETANIAKALSWPT